MDDVLNKLENTTISPQDSSLKNTNFDGLYKNWGRLGNQDERRKEILGVQKSNRNTNLDKCRGILELIQEVEEPSIFQTENPIYYRPNIYVAGFQKVKSYGKVLMMSEWMIEKPFDFDTNWVVVPSPKATRVLVVACNGITKLYTKYGQLTYQCRTGLPGGNPCNRKATVNCCVLDCFFQKTHKILHVLDLLAWNSQPMTDGELEFRDYWLKTQLFELDDIKVVNKKNHLIFNLLPKVSCEPESFKEFMLQTHFNQEITQLDGLLFFHKKAHYFSGETPLVGWLYPYMVPEVIGSHVTVNSLYMVQKPENYTNQADFITQFNKKLENKVTRASNRKMNAINRRNEIEAMEAEAFSYPTNRGLFLTKESLNAESSTSIDDENPFTKSTEFLTEMDADATNTVKSVISAAMDAEILDEKDEK